jgi:DNA-binding IclR family transcriptional regulator
VSAATGAVSRALRVILALAGHTFDGARLKAVASAVEQSSPTTLRDLQGLESEGWVERVPGAEDRWRLSPRPVQIAYAHQAEMARLEQRMADMRNRYTREPT